MKTKGIISALLISALISSNAMGLAFARDGWNRGRDSNNWEDSNNQDDSGNNWRRSDRGNSRGVFARDNQMQITPRQMHRAQMLSNNDQNTINNRIDSIPQIRRLNFLLWVLSRVETLRMNIEGSSRTAEHKARLVALLDDIVDIIQNKISDITRNSAEVDDNTPPATLAFSVSQIGGNSAMISTTVDDNWNGFFVVLPSGNTAPTATQVKAGQNGAGGLVAIRGSSAIKRGTSQFLVTGLMPSTNYTAYFVAEDTFENLQNMPVVNNFTTLSTGGGTGTGTTDTTAPVITAVSLSGITSTGAMLWLTSNESGTVYHVLLPSWSTAPTVAQVKAWQDAAGTLVTLRGTFAIVSGSSNQFNITGLAPATNYVVYFVAQDTAGNITSTNTANLTTNL